MATDKNELKEKLASMNNNAAEQSVIGTLLSRAQDAQKVGLVPDDFYNPHHQFIFNHIVNTSGDVVDIISLSSLLSVNSNGAVSPADMLGYLDSLTQAADPDTLMLHGMAVARHSYDRKLLQASRELDLLSLSPLDPDEKSAKAEEIIGQSRPSGAKKASRSLADAVREVVESLEAASQNEKTGLGIQTGFTDLDRIVTALMPGDLIILGGRPGMGKTTLAMDIAKYVSVHYGATGIFSMEMPDTQLALRQLSGESDIDSKTLRSGKLNQSEWNALKAAATDLSWVNMFIDDISGITPGELRLRVKRMIQRHGKIKLLVVDYLQLLKKTDPRQSTTDATTEASGTLKQIAKEFGFPVIALSQLSREVEKRVDKRPMPSDLRDSGSIEQDADLIIFVYRDEVYNKETQDPGVAEIIIGKNRSGPLGIARLRFDGDTTSFHNMDPADIGFPDDDPF